MAMKGLNSGRTGQDEPAPHKVDPHEAAPHEAAPHEAAPDEAPAYRPGLLTTGLGLLRTPGTGSPLRWFFSAIWLVYLIQPVHALFGHDHGVLWIAGGLAITVAFCVIYVPTVIDTDRRPRLA